MYLFNHFFRIINMKKYILSAILFVIAMPCFAQRDVKTLEGRTPEQIIAIFGTPVVKDYSTTEYMCPVVFYGTSKFFFVDTSKNSTPNWACQDIETSDPGLCVLSDYIDGGIKVGDPFSKLQSIDFVHSQYGRNKEGNALKSSEIAYDIISHPANYVVFEEEYQSIYFSVENGIITAFSVISKEDTPYPNYDFSVSIW